MAETTHRLEQEIARLGGDYAHVLSESIEPRHDETTGEAWLHGAFTYTLFREPDPSAAVPPGRVREIAWMIQRRAHAAVDAKASERSFQRDAW